MSLIREWLYVFGVIGSALAAAVGPPGTVPTNSAPVHTAPPKAVWSGPCAPTREGGRRLGEQGSRMRYNAVDSVRVLVAGPN